MDIEPVLTAFKKGLGILYGVRLKQVILYGSWARGEATIDSDIDLLVVLAGQVQPGREIDRMIELITDVNLEYGVLLSIYPVSAEAYASIDSPLLLNVRREGKAA